MSMEGRSRLRVHGSQGGIPAVQGRNSYIFLLPCITERGPFGARMVNSFDSFKKLYGDFIATGQGAQWIWDLQGEAGRQSQFQVWVNRIVHYTGASPSSAAGSVTLLDNTGTATIATLLVEGKTHGAYTDLIKIRVRAASDGVAVHFDLLVEKDGVVAETWINLTMLSTDPRYAETIINDAVKGSDLIKVTDQDIYGDDPSLKRPANGLSAYMTGGSDGLVGLVDADFSGDSSLHTGLYAFTGVQRADILAIPDRPTSAVHNAALAFCMSDRDGKCYFLADPPTGYTPAQIADWVRTTAATLGLTQCGEQLYPRMQISNPNTTVFGTSTLLAVAPSGLRAGLLARVAAESKDGKFHNAAGKQFPFLTVRAFEGEDENRNEKHAIHLPENQDLVTGARINYFRKDDTGPFYLDNEDTLKVGSGTDFPLANEQLGSQEVMKAVEETLDIVRHMDLANPTEDESVQAQCHQSVDKYLGDLTDAGAFVSKDHDLAYTIDFGPGVNTPDIAKQNMIKGYIGLATKNVAKWGDVTVAKDTRKNDAQAAG